MRGPGGNFYLIKNTVFIYEKKGYIPRSGKIGSLSDRMSTVYQKLESAFKKPRASDACVAIGKVYLKSNKEYSLDELKTLSKTTEPEFTQAIIRLTKREKVLEYRPYITTRIVKKGVKIPIKYKMKKEYFSLLKKNEADFFL